MCEGLYKFVNVWIKVLHGKVKMPSEQKEREREREREPMLIITIALGKLSMTALNVGPYGYSIPAMSHLNFKMENIGKQRDYSPLLLSLSHLRTHSPPTHLVCG